jgi:hypothetical protein
MTPQPQQQPAQQPTAGDPFAEFGGSLTAESPASANPTTQTMTPTTPTSDPFAEFGGTASGTSADKQPENDPRKTGEIVNDTGNKVIVPKEGESFGDTMRRAAAYGKTVTPEQIDAEMKTAPRKAAQVVAAAPVIGAAGTAGLAAPVEIPAAVERVLQISEQALEHLAENYPQLTKLAGKLGYGAGAAGAYKLLNKLGIH